MYKSVLLGATLAFSGMAGAMTLNEYLAQVKAQSLAYQGQETRASALTLTAREIDLITSPVFFTNARAEFNGKMNNPPAPSYEDVKTNTLTMGLSQQFTSGLKATFSYSIINTKYVGANFNPGVDDKFWDLSPRVELSMPLWGNGFGRSLRAQQEVSRQQNLAEKYNSLAQSESLLADAEFAYWRLATALERVEIQEAALKAGRNIFGFVDTQKRKNLGETADVLQARALTEANELQLQQAINEREAAKRDFNTFLNITADTSIPELENLNYNSLEETPDPGNRIGDRLDVKAARAQTALAKANSELLLERNKPTLDLIGGYALNGRGTGTGTAFENASKTTRDAGYVAVELQIPLNFKATSDVRAGAKQLKDSAEINEKHLTYKQDQDWFALKQRLAEAKATLKLSRSMEKAQKAKLDNERLRLRQGRTTTYQVLLFEQDYTQAQASRVQTARDIIALKTQFKLFANTPAGEI